MGGPFNAKYYTALDREIFFFSLKGKKNLSRKNEMLSNTIRSVSLLRMYYIHMCVSVSNFKHVVRYFSDCMEFRCMFNLRNYFC